MREQEESVTLAFLIVLSTIVILSFGSCRTEAVALSQEAPTQTTARQVDRGDAGLWLARICVSESGWDSPADCSAILEVLRWGGYHHGTHWLTHAQSYSRRLFGGARRHRGWPSHLRVDGEEPEQWPSTVAWSAYRARWLSILATARRMAAHPTANCEEAPTDWGGRVDLDRARRLGMVPVSCGATRNWFFVRRSQWIRRHPDWPVPAIPDRPPREPLHYGSARATPMSVEVPATEIVEVSGAHTVFFAGDAISVWLTDE